MVELTLALTPGMDANDWYAFGGAPYGVCFKIGNKFFSI